MFIPGLAMAGEPIVGDGSDEAATRRVVEMLWCSMLLEIISPRPYQLQRRLPVSARCKTEDQGRIETPASEFLGRHGAQDPRRS